MNNGIAFLAVILPFSTSKKKLFVLVHIFLEGGNKEGSDVINFLPACGGVKYEFCESY